MNNYILHPKTQMHTSQWFQPKYESYFLIALLWEMMLCVEIILHVVINYDLMGNMELILRKMNTSNQLFQHVSCKNSISKVILVYQK